MERTGTVFNIVSIDHKRKKVTLHLTHIYNPSCEGCRNDLNEAKAIAKQYGYAFELDEPKNDKAIGCIINLNSATKGTEFKPLIP